ncbi:Fe-S cluster assembly ATPase SufC [Patescibacteria group bacterium]|nr:Fe-S cluster assembly ATPase SufC [Patescibacteria group bacterium]MBU1916373.1 Fe-S cluster assembly ATPase SufC [Patescibacteria group bacterium]
MAEVIIENLHVSRAGKEILHGVDLIVKRGEVVALMGPNGSGKSTLAETLMGHPECLITSGRIIIDGTDITLSTPDKRAKAGLFLSLQNPPEIPGLTLAEFLRAAYNEIHEEQISARDFRRLLTEKAAALHMSTDLLARGLNQGFSGGERKKSEILQLMILSPKYAVLDETDSGLDVDALRVVGEGINTLRSAPTASLSILVITHQRKLLEYLKPDQVIIMSAGQIIRTGGSKLAQEIEEKGYNF